MTSGHLPESRALVASDRWRIAAIILAIALALRLWGLTAEPAWLDEVYTLQLSEGQPTRILEANAADVHPPAYYLGLAQWRARFGSSLEQIRSFSVAWSLVGVLFVILLAADLGLPRWGVWLAGLLTAVNPTDIFFAQEARMYAQAAALGVASSWFLLRAWTARLQAQPKLMQGLWLAGYVGLVALLLHTLYVSVFVLLAQGICLLAAAASRRDRGAVAAYLSASLLSALLLLPWLLFMRVHGPHRLGRLDWISSPAPGDALKPFYRDLFLGRIGPREPWHLALYLVSAVVSLAVGTVVISALVRMPRRSRNLALLVAMTCLPILLAVVASHLYRPVFFPARFPVLVVPFFMTLIAAVTTRITRPAWQRALALTALGLLIIATVIQHREITKPGMREFAELYRRLGPPDHLVLLPPSNLVTTSFELGMEIENADQQEILRDREQGRDSLLWVGVDYRYLNTADPGVRRIHDWLLTLGPVEDLAIVDRLQVWQVTVPASNPESSAKH